MLVKGTTLPNSINAVSYIGTKFEVYGGYVKKVRHEPELEE